MSDRSREIDRKDWLILKNLYFSKSLKNCTSFITIDYYIRWFDQELNSQEMTFYSLNGDFSDGTFAAITRGDYVYADTLNKTNDNLFRLIRVLDHSRDYIFQHIREGIQSTIEEAIKLSNARIKGKGVMMLYQCPQTTAINLDVSPNEIELRPLNEQSDVRKVSSNNAKIFSNFEKLSKYNRNVGAFKRDGTLVSWVYQDQTGLVGRLQTDAEYLHRGYGILVTRHLSKEISQAGYDIYAGILEDNLPSRNLFTKLGFNLVGQTYFIVTGNDEKST